ncbi:protein BREAST CANCER SUSCEPTIBILITY 2 homolog B-like [Andrographis paniculata]|uniref:protein BREAST CANCER SUSCEPTIBILITY 2 homolog B-like n=1 Tax=Andrographis paniculata TaxID=175694 RepID=UPI0021E8EF5C|nr:protein BREAST CANCER SUSCEPTIBILITY 2 homolog B-like [Andrographis paniculata]
MSTWQIFPGAGNSFRWEISNQELQKEEHCDVALQQDADPQPLPSMADLLFLGCSEILEEHIGNTEDAPLFRTGLGKSVAVKQSSIKRARLVLGDVDEVPTDTGHLDEGKNGDNSSKPVFEMGSFTSVSMLRPEIPNASESAVSISNSMFQTGSGKTVHISSTGLRRAKTLLGIDVNSDQESLPLFGQTQIQSSSLELFGWEDPSHLENGGETCSFGHISSSKVLPSFGNNLCRIEANRFTGSSKTGPKSPIKFHTAGGRSISVSSDALQRARSLLGNLETDSFLDDESSAHPMISGEKPGGSDNNHDFSAPFLEKGIENCYSSSRNFISPLKTYSYQKNQKQSSKFRKIQPGSNLMTKFDAEATTNTSKETYREHAFGTKSLQENYYLGEVDCLGNTVQPKYVPSKRTLVDITNTMNTDNTGNKQCLNDKRRPKRFASASPFKKPRSSFITPLKRSNSSLSNDLSRLAPKEVCFKPISTRYPLQVSRKYLKEFVPQSPHQEKLENLPEHVKRMNPLAAARHIFQNEMASDTIGIETFCRMLSYSGVSPQYMTKEWVSNHYKWIVWKLASYERCYPAKFAGKLLTVNNVLEELRYRYEREVNHGHRSAIKKILDGDAPPSSTMVLCISSIGGNSNPNVGHQYGQLGKTSYDKDSKIELTDGWYSVKAQLDELLSQQLASGKLFLGQKLKICGAKLSSWLGPVSPLETSQQPCLHLHINGTYRCHWAEKLGFCKNAGVPLAFRCIKGTGGAIPSTLVGVTRIYPILYRERLSDTSFIVRSERMEAKALQLYNQRRSFIAEEISAFHHETDFDVGNDHESEEGAKIMKLLETAAEPEVLMAGMSSKQLTSFASYKAKLEAIRQSDLQKSIEKAIEAAGLNKRDVTPFMRIKVVGLTHKFHRKDDGSRKGLVTIWNPTKQQMLELSEGHAYAVGGLLPSSSDSGILYLQARGSTSNWLPLAPLTMENYEPFFTPRSSTTLSSLGKVPLSSEFDIAAFVVYVGEVYTHGHQQKQWVFVTDGSTDESCENRSQDTLLAINFCLPCAESCSYTCAPVNSNIAASVVGFCNLIKRRRDEANGLWVAEATENSEYFLSYDDARRKHLKEAAALVLNWASSSGSIIHKLEDRVVSIIQKSKDGY